MDLRPIDQTKRDIARLNAALAIYRDTILPEARNPERQIIHWIDCGNDELKDEFRCFAIQDGEKVVGYLQYSYFREEHVFFFEYFCVIGKRKGLAQSMALKAIEQHLADNYAPEFTIVFEVAQKPDADGIWVPDDRLIAYFRRLGFREVQFEYRYPVLQSYEGPTSYPADLLIRLPNARTTVSATELRTILRCLYFKHYLRWDRPFLDSGRFSERERLINELYADRVAQIGRDDSFGTKGDDKRSGIVRFISRQKSVGPLLSKIFGPKLPRVAVAIAIPSVMAIFVNPLAVPVLVLTGALIFCLGEDTATANKLALSIIRRLNSGRQQK